MKLEKKQRFSIRKYAIGAASVLIGFAFGTQVVSADSVTPTPEHAASVLGIDTQFPTVFQTKTTKLEATGQVLAYSETYKRADYYKIKFISCNRGH